MFILFSERQQGRDALAPINGGVDHLNRRRLFLLPLRLLLLLLLFLFPLGI